MSLYPTFGPILKDRNAETAVNRMTCQALRVVPMNQGLDGDVRGRIASQKSTSVTNAVMAAVDNINSEYGDDHSVHCYRATPMKSPMLPRIHAKTVVSASQLEVRGSNLTLTKVTGSRGPGPE